MGPEEKLSWLGTVAPWAQASQQDTGVPACVTLAQAILESNWGQSKLSREAFNYFGIKPFRASDPYIEMTTTEYDRGRPLKVLARFRRFASPKECFEFRGRWLSRSQRYAPCMEVKDDPLEFCARLAQCGYATDPEYAKKLVAVILAFDLQKFDLPPGPAGKAEA